jgi:hypothetical protein
LERMQRATASSPYMFAGIIRRQPGRKRCRARTASSSAEEYATSSVGEHAQPVASDPLGGLAGVAQVPRLVGVEGGEAGEQVVHHCTGMHLEIQGLQGLLW